MIPSKAEIERALSELPGWRHRGNAIERVFSARIRRIDCVRQRDRGCGERGQPSSRHHHLVKSRDAHADFHDSGGLTQRDFSLARTIDTLAPSA